MWGEFPAIAGTLVAQSLIEGFLLSWLYALARPRLGPGPKTALLMGSIGFAFANPHFFGISVWVTYPGAAYTPDPSGQPVLPTPNQSGPPPNYGYAYDAADSRWLPVMPSLVSPDGTHYVFTDSNANLSTVDVRTGLESTPGMPIGSFMSQSNSKSELGKEFARALKTPGPFSPTD